MKRRTEASTSVRAELALGARTGVAFREDDGALFRATVSLTLRPQPAMAAMAAAVTGLVILSNRLTIMHDHAVQMGLNLRLGVS